MSNRKTFNAFIAEEAPDWNDQTGLVMRAVLERKEIPVTNDQGDLETWVAGLQEPYCGFDRVRILRAIQVAHLRWNAETEPGRTPWAENPHQVTIDPQFSGMCKVYGADHGLIERLRKQKGLPPPKSTELADLPARSEKEKRAEAAAKLAGVTVEEFERERVKVAEDQHQVVESSK